MQKHQSSDAQHQLILWVPVHSLQTNTHSSNSNENKHELTAKITSSPLQKQRRALSRYQHLSSPSEQFQSQQSVSKDLTWNTNTWVPGDQSPVLWHRHAPECPLTCDGEDINSCEAPWRRRFAVIIQMKDYEKGRAVTPAGGPKEPDARRDVWLLVTVVSRQESAPSAGIASRCV